MPPQEKAAAFRPDQEFLRLPVDSILTWVTCPLRSTDITPLPRYYEAVRPWSERRYYRPRGSSICAFSLCITDPVLKFRTKAQIRVMPPIRRTPHWPVSRSLPCCSQDRVEILVLVSSKPFRRFISGSFVGIELERARCRRGVTSLTLSVARWVHIPVMTTFPEAPR